MNALDWVKPTTNYLILFFWNIQFVYILKFLGSPFQNCSVIQLPIGSQENAIIILSYLHQSRIGQQSLYVADELRGNNSRADQSKSGHSAFLSLKKKNRF